MFIAMSPSRNSVQILLKMSLLDDFIKWKEIRKVERKDLKAHFRYFAFLKSPFWQNFITRYVLIFAKITVPLI